MKKYPVVAWREVGKPGEPYPAWMRAIKNRSGVYAIGTIGLLGHTVLYVGESHKGRLKKTIARHFQRWARGKSWWSGIFKPSDADPGHTYDRASCRVAFFCTPPAEAITAQADWIARLKPRDNVLEVVPF